MTARRIQRRRKSQPTFVNDTTALAMWMRAEAAAERAARRREQMYGVMTLCICALSATLVIAVAVLLVDLVVG